VAHREIEDMEKNGQYKIGIEARLTTLEVRVSELIDNHIPHLEAKMNRMMWLIVTTLVAIIINLMTAFLKKI
jgi:hypothetical protein